jgi:cytochrome c553
MKFALVTAVLLSSIGLVNVANADSIDKGKTLVEKGNCASCHGAGLNAPVSPAYPKLAGQPADYLYYALRAYQVGASNANYGRVNAIMAAQVKGTPDVNDYSQQDLKDIAAYISSLPGTLVIKK